MSELDQQLREYFDGRGGPEPQRSDEFREEIVHLFEKKLIKVRRNAWMHLAIASAFVLLGTTLVAIGAAISTRTLMIGVMIVLAAIQIQTLLKLWYWQMNTKLNLLKDLKELRLDISEERRRGDSANSGAGEESSTEAGAS